MTEFKANIRSEPELVDALLSGEFRPIYIEETAAVPVG